MAKPSTESLADLLFPTEEQEEFANSILQVPPEARRLHTETYDFTVSTLLNSYLAGNIYIPEFQRGYVWSDAQASRLVESLIIQCPIPVIYLSQDKEEKMAVIDGQQRIKSLHRYINNEFELIGLTAYPELEGNRFHQLDSRFQRHIQNRTLRCMTILKETHPQVKFDIFERLNTGSVKLSFQELRHAMNFGPFMKLVEHLATNKFLKSAAKVKAKRMKHEELIIRFLALKFSRTKYEKPLTFFLNKFSEENRSADSKILQKFEKEFNETIKFVEDNFGPEAFKISYKGTIVSNFNAALYDGVMIACSDFRNKTLKSKKKPSHSDLMEYIEKNTDLKKAISQATSDENQVKTRIQEIKSFLATYYS